MKKKIIFSDGKTKKMTFEEVRQHFESIVNNRIRSVNSKFLFNRVEEDDFKQELEIELWRAYEDYEPKSGNCFTTYLHYKLLKGIRKATYNKYSLKNQGISLSLNTPIGEKDLKIEDSLTSEDNTLDLILEKELCNIIYSIINDGEEDILKVLLNKKEFSVQGYANKYSISRQAANQRIMKVRKRLQKVIKEQYIDIN